MASIDELKRRIDLHQLADRLGLKQGKGGDKALYHSPHHPDKHPSLSIYQNHPKHGTGWKDHSGDDGGSCIDLVMFVLGCNVSDAMKYLHEAFGIPFDTPTNTAPAREKTKLDYIAERSLKEADKVIDYLADVRGIARPAIAAAVKAKTLGFNDYTSSTRKQGEVGYCGPAAAFIVRPLNGVEVSAVDMRFIDPSLNGDVKTQTQGEKDGIGWTADPKKLERARRVVLVESSINALSIDSCELPATAAYSIRGIGNAANIDFSFLAGKHVVICMDNDEPIVEGKPRAGHRPGPEAGWLIYERLTALNIAASIVDQSDWIKDLADGAKKKAELINDVNDYLKERGAEALAKALDQLDPWLIAGLPGDATARGKRRVYLPSHDFAQYWRYRTTADFTRYIAKMEHKEEADAPTPVYADLCGFRIASLSRVSVASASSTMTGDADQAPSVYFAASVQLPRHGAKLVRKVMLDDQLHNNTHWLKFGPIWKPAEFSRMVSILERTADLGARNAANFVGLAWRDGKLAVNEGPDCYFT
ncbi:toprim domain-containing protein, partial [Paraburkholderia lycopersici]